MSEEQKNVKLSKEIVEGLIMLAKGEQHLIKEIKNHPDTPPSIKNLIIERMSDLVERLPYSIKTAGLEELRKEGKIK